MVATHRPQKSLPISILLCILQFSVISPSGTKPNENYGSKKNGMVIDQSAKEFAYLYLVFWQVVNILKGHISLPTSHQSIITTNYIL